MATDSERTSADIQREIDADRQRIGNRIDAIQERMSPGQLVDEVISYTKNSGGGEYVANLGNAVKTNPLPVALVGVGLAWLMAKQGTGTAAPASSGAVTQDQYPLYPAVGPVKRLGPPETSGEGRFSHFADTSGKRLKALTDETGRRAGHFVDETGKTYRGFADASGRRIEDIRDETGALLDAASGWASHTWGAIKENASSVQAQAGALNQAILHQFRDQPLVGGALAFAVGAAIGAALPHTDQEDRMFGEASDNVKDSAATKAGTVVDRASAATSDAYASAVAVASDLHDSAKDRVKAEVDGLKSSSSDRGQAV